MNLLGWLLLTFGGACATHALVPGETAGFVDIGDHRRLYVEETRALPGKPTFVMLNGLDYTTREWSDLAGEMRRAESGVGIVRYNMRAIDLDDQVADLVRLIDRLRLPAPPVLVGLSYGGGVLLKTAVARPDLFRAFVPLAPLLFKLPDEEQKLADLVRVHRVIYPWDFRSNETLYNLYVHLGIYTLPAAFPSLWRNWPLNLERMFRMIKGIGDWDANRIVTKLPRGRVHPVFAEDDDCVRIKYARPFVENAPAGTWGSVLYLRHVGHRIPEVVPRAIARWLLRIAADEPALRAGHVYGLDARQPTQCETLLKPAGTPDLPSARP